MTDVGFSSAVFEAASIAVRVANPMPVMSIVFIVGVFGPAPTPVRIPVAGDAHTMVAIQIATFVDAGYESSSGRGVMRGRVTRRQGARYGGREKHDF